MALRSFPLGAFLAVSLSLVIPAPQAAAQSTVEWRDPGLMRSFLRKAASPDRLTLYRAWLSLPSLEKPYVSEELGYALASDFPALDPPIAAEIGGLLETAMGRGRLLWDDRGDSREKLAAAMLDRPER